VRHASLRDLKAIYRHFQSHRDIFPHVRQDRLKRRIEASEVIWQDDVIITYQQYKKKTRVGDVQVPRGAVVIHQILNSNQFSGNGGEVFEQFFDEIVKSSGGDLYLSVREENTLACAFYERHGMSVAGKVVWAGGTLPGLIFRRGND
jgi:hypothetical protein